MSNKLFPMKHETQSLLTVGTRVFNGGDMANPEHFGTVTKITKNNYTSYEITPDEWYELEPYTTPACGFSSVYEGHGGTRFVTAAAYDAWRNKQVNVFTINRSKIEKK